AAITLGAVAHASIATVFPVYPWKQVETVTPDAPMLAQEIDSVLAVPAVTARGPAPVTVTAFVGLLEDGDARDGSRADAATGTAATAAVPATGPAGSGPGTAAAAQLRARRAAKWGLLHYADAVAGVYDLAFHELCRHAEVLCAEDGAAAAMLWWGMR